MIAEARHGLVKMLAFHRLDRRHDLRSTEAEGGRSSDGGTGDV